MVSTKKVDLFLDSGAYSAKTLKIVINIQDYIKFIKRHEKIIEVYANLDVIGDPKATLENQKIMEGAGLHPLPVFHHPRSPSHWKYLDYYVGRYKYIALGGITGERAFTYFNTVFRNYICDDKGMPKVKVHGFGLTSLRLMLEYPWYSLDSTSWVITGRLGSIYVPMFRDGKWIYNENSLKITVSSRSPFANVKDKHFNTLSPNVQKLILKYIEYKGYKLGESIFKNVEQSYSPKDNERWAEKKPLDKKAKRSLEIVKEPGISNTYQLRDELNIIYFQDFEEASPPWPQPYQPRRVKGFF